MIETTATVEQNSEVVPGYKLLTLEFDKDINALPGQFAMLRARNREPLLRRAFAVYLTHGPRRISFLYQIIGRGTRAISALKPGMEMDILVPLGNSWPLPADESRRAIVVSGGIGSASVLMLCRQLKAAGIDTQVFFGASSRSVAAGCGIEEFKALGLPLTITTDDGSLGEKGFVSLPLERHLETGAAEGATIYACGPWAMMKSVAAIAEKHRVSCLVSLEAPMGCGFGVCVGCVVAVKTDDPSGYGAYKRVCTDGSIFPAEIIRWDVTAMNH